MLGAQLWALDIDAGTTRNARRSAAIRGDKRDDPSEPYRHMAPNSKVNARIAMSMNQKN